MEITNVKVYKISNSKSNLKAFASINLDDELVVKNLKVVEGKNGLFTAFPSEKGSDGNYYDMVYALNDDTRDYINEKVLEAYEAQEDEKPAKKSTSRRK